MALTAPNPLTIPAVGEKVFDKLWVTSLLVSAIGPGKPVQLLATISWARQLGDGSYELSKTTKIVRLLIEDLYSLAGGDTSVQTLIDNVLNKVKDLAIAQGIL